jgi:hypothetical protein
MTRMSARYALGIALIAAGLAGCQPDGPDTQAASLLTDVRTDAWDTPYGPGRRLVTPHYEIYTTVGGKNLARFLPGFMEAANDYYLRLTGLPARRAGERLTVYMLADRQQWTALMKHRTGRVFDIHAGGLCINGVCVFWDIGMLRSLSVAAHEGLHQFFHYRLKDRLPMWLEEGLCTTAEGYRLEGHSVVFTPRKNLSRFTDLRNAIVSQRWRSLDELLPLHSAEVAEGHDPERAVGYYGQLWALAHFLRTTEPYRSGLRRLLADAEAGRLHRALDLPPEAIAKLRRRPTIYNRTVSRPLFEHYITDDLDAFERQYRDYAVKLAGLAPQG